MKQQVVRNQEFSPADKTKIIAISIFLCMLLIILGFLVGLSFRQRGFQLPLRAIRAQPTPTSSIPLAIPLTGNCTSSTLVLGTTTFQIQNLTRKADGSLSVPKDTSGIAYRVEGIGNPVFVLSPTPQNITVMETISIGSTAQVTGPDCISISYRLAAPQSGSLDESAFDGSSTESITVFFPTVSSGAGFVYKGVRIE